jgi:hypothetical protein
LAGFKSLFGLREPLFANYLTANVSVENGSGAGGSGVTYRDKASLFGRNPKHQVGKE